MVGTVGSSVNCVGKKQPPAMEAGGAGKPGEAAFVKVMKVWLDQ